MERRRWTSKRQQSRVSYLYITYQFHYMPASPFHPWASPKPDLSRIDSAEGRSALWSCLAASGLTNLWIGHDALEEPYFEGINATFTDGSTNWVDTVDLEWYFGTSAERYYWPRPSERAPGSGPG